MNRRITVIRNSLFSPQNAITHIFEMAAGPVRELFGRGYLNRTEDNDVMEEEDAIDSSITTTEEDEGMKYLSFEPKKTWVPPCSLLSFRYLSTARTRRHQ